MSNPESVVRRRVIRAIHQVKCDWVARAFALAVENSCWPGTPDVWYCIPARGWNHPDAYTGWIEIKQTRAPRKGQPIKWSHPFTTEQRLFARQVAKADGCSWFLARVGRVHYLVPGHVAAVQIDKETTVDDLEAMSVKSWARAGDLDRDLLDVLIRYNYG